VLQTERYGGADNIAKFLWEAGAKKYSARGLATSWTKEKDEGDRKKVEIASRFSGGTAHV